MGRFIRQRSFLVLTVGIVPLLSLVLIAWGYQRGEGQVAHRSEVYLQTSYVICPGLLGSMDPVKEFHDWLQAEKPEAHFISRGASPDRFHITLTKNGERQFNTWLDERFGPENWRPEEEEIFDLMWRWRNFAFGTVAMRNWSYDAHGKPVSFEHSYCAWQYTLESHAIYYSKILALYSTGMAYLGSPWLAVPVALYLLFIPAYFLRRPILRVLRLRKHEDSSVLNDSH